MPGMDCKIMQQYYGGGTVFSRLCPGDMQTVESWELKFEHAGLLNVYFKQLEVRAALRLSF